MHSETLAPDTTHSTVAVIVPTLNEVDNIAPLLERIVAVSPGIEAALEVLIADGGSSDGTQDAVRTWSGDIPVRVVECSGMRGLSGDVLEAATSTTADIIVVMDADLSHSPESIPDLLAPLLAGTHEMTVGSRYVPGGATPGWPRRRRLLSRLASVFAWPLTDVRDPMSGFFAIDRGRMLDLGEHAEGFKIGLEIMARGDEVLRIHEVPITFVDRTHGESKLQTGHLLDCVRQVLALTGGGAATMRTATRFSLVGLVGLALDLVVFNTLLNVGATVSFAHTYSFAVATICNYMLNASWAFRDTARESTETDLKRYFRFLAVCILAVFMRDAVLNASMQSLALSPRTAILPAIAAAAIVNFIGSAFFIFARADDRSTPALRWRGLALVVVAYSIALRVAFAGIVDLLPEEAYYWNYAQHLDFGYLDHPPMVAWLIWLSTSLFGDSEFTVRLPALVSWVVAATFMYALARNLFEKTVATRALLLVAVLPVYFCVGFFMMPDAPLYTAWAGSLCFLERALLARKRYAWLGFGICLGLGMLSKYTIALLWPAAVVFAVLDRPSRQWFFRWQPYAAAVLSALLFSPVILWNIQHEWASFAFQGVRRWSGDVDFSLHLMLGAMLLLLTPFGVIGIAREMFRQRRTSDDPHPIDAHVRRVLFARVFTLAPLAVFAVNALRSHPKLNWTGPVWLAAIPLLAYGIAPCVRTDQLHRVLSSAERCWRSVTVGSLIVLGFLLSVMVTAPSALPELEKMQLPLAWEEMIAEVEDIERRISRESGEDPIVIGIRNYFISSQYAFYQRSRETRANAYGCGSLGDRGLMWDYWRPHESITGRNALIIAFDRAALKKKRLGRYFEILGDVEEVGIVKNGSLVGHFFYRLGHDYRPPDRLINQPAAAGTPIATISTDRVRTP